MQYQPLTALLVDCAATRQLDIIYQNLSGQPIIVIASVECLTTGAGSQAAAQAEIGTVSPPGLFIGNTGIATAPAVANHSVRGMLVFCAPPNYFYRIARLLFGGGSTVTQLTWFELTLTAPYGAGF